MSDGGKAGDGVDATHKNSAATSERTTPAAKEEEVRSGRKDRGMGLQDERGGVCSYSSLFFLCGFVDGLVLG